MLLGSARLKLLKSNYTRISGYGADLSLQKNGGLKKQTISDMDASDRRDSGCMFCDGLFSEETNGEEWIKCQGCYP